MREIRAKDKAWVIPEYLDELLPQQYRFLLLLYSAFMQGMMPGEEVRRRWLSHLLGMEDYRILLPEYVSALECQLPFLDSFFSGDGCPDLRTSRNLLPQEGEWTGPGDWLRGVSYGEFVEALTVMELMGEGEEEDDYEEMAAHVARVLYKIPAGKEVPPILLIHAPRLVANVWEALQAGPVVINGREIDFRIIFKNEGGSRMADDRTGWTGITFELAEKGLFGKLDDVEKADLWSVLLYLYKCKFEYINEKSRQG